MNLNVRSESNHIYKIIYNGTAGDFANACNVLKKLARPAGLEPATLGLEDRCYRFFGQRIFGALELLRNQRVVESC